MPKKIVNVEDGTITFAFEDDTKEVFELSKAEALVRHLALHGASQKIGDEYSSAGSKPDPLAYAKACVQDMIERLYRGDWKQASAGIGKRANQFVLAFAEASGLSVEEAAAHIDGLEEEEKKALQAKPKIKAIILRMRAEAAAAKAAKAAKLAEAEEG